MINIMREGVGGGLITLEHAKELLKGKKNKKEHAL